MKKIKGNMKLIIGVAIGILISVTTSYSLAETLIKSADVSYVDNSNLKATNVQAAIDGTCTKFSNDLVTLQTTIINKIYPVGSIYISYNGTNPSSFLGGTWEAFGKGQTLVGVDTSQTEFNTVGKTGGEKTHTLTVDEMPSHTHDFVIGGQALVIGTFKDTIPTDSGIGAEGYWKDYSKNLSSLNSTGGSQAHNNLQPYITVYMWKRTK